MIKKWQPVYPSSNVAQETIDEYGWRFIEEIPARINDTGHLTPVPEASDYLRELRAVIDERPTIPLVSESGVLTIEDFAVARLPESPEQKLGFFALLPKESA